MYCQSCGQENPAEAQFCQRCGARTIQNPPEVPVEQRFHQFATEVELLAKKVGRHRFQGGLGFFGPLVYAFIIIAVVAALGVSLEALSDPGDLAHDLGSFLVNGLFIFFLAALLFGYMFMLTPLNPKGLILLRPLATATAVTFSLWLAFNIFDILGRVYEIDALGSLADLVLIILPMILILLLVIGYALVLSRELERRAKQKTPPAVKPPRDLYRSGKERLLGGVGGGLAEYVETDPSVIRVLFILSAAVTLGIFALIYLVLWALPPRNPVDDWS